MAVDKVSQTTRLASCNFLATAIKSAYRESFIQETLWLSQCADFNLVSGNSFGLSVE